MLEQFGYEKGLGLGSRAEGIVEPVKALKFIPGRSLDYINSVKVANCKKQKADLGVALREAAERLKEATGEAGDEGWNGAFALASSININSDGATTKPPAPGGRITSFDQWKQARAEERKIDAAVDNYNRVVTGEKAPAPEKTKTKSEAAKDEAIEEANSQRLRVVFLQKRMKDADQAFQRNRFTDKHIAAQAQAIAEECRAELAEARTDSAQAETNLHKTIKKNKKFKF